MILSESYNFSRKKVIWFLILIVLHSLDAIFSNVFMSVDLSNEANLFVAFVFSELGSMGVWFIKILLFIPLATVLPYIKIWILYVLNIIMIPIVLTGGIMAYNLV